MGKKRKKEILAQKELYVNLKSKAWLLETSVIKEKASLLYRGKKKRYLEGILKICKIPFIVSSGSKV